MRIMMVLALIGLLFFGCLVKGSQPVYGKASWYSYKSCRIEGTSGVWTASGERFNENDYTCAIRSKSFYKIYRVTNCDNGKSVMVWHNDYGPGRKATKRGVVIDLSKAAFKKIADLDRGVVEVKVERFK